MICCILFYPVVISNPIPVKTEAGSPVVDRDTKIRFVDETITYTIDDEFKAFVSACYQFYNPTNDSVGLVIYLPIDGDVSDLTIFVNDAGVEIDKKENGFSMFTDGEVYNWISFNASFPANNITMINATYITYTGKTNTFFTSIYETGYISKTGSTWNDTINATFSFKINKELYSFGLSDFKMTNDDNYVIASKSFENWMPDRNINVEWQQFQFGLGGICILSILAIIVLFYGIERLIHKRKKGI
jgi:hypothetical protein